MAVCPIIRDDLKEGLEAKYNDPDALEVPFGDNVTLTCNQLGKPLRGRALADFRQCVYDPRYVFQLNL